MWPCSCLRALGPGPGVLKFADQNAVNCAEVTSGMLGALRDATKKNIEQESPVRPQGHCADSRFRLPAFHPGGRPPKTCDLNLPPQDPASNAGQGNRGCGKTSHTPWTTGFRIRLTPAPMQIQSEASSLTLVPRAELVVSRLSQASKHLPFLVALDVHGCFAVLKKGKQLQVQLYEHRPLQLFAVGD